MALRGVYKITGIVDNPVLWFFQCSDSSLVQVELSPEERLVLVAVVAPGHGLPGPGLRVLRLVLQKVPSEFHPKVRNHGEGPY